MTLSPGTLFGPYRVTALIGVGAMGEVYRGTDPRLKRGVAIKVLPAPFASDSDRLARFQREAEVLASLNHANIAHIYGIERGDGTTAPAMELVEGETLAERIARGGRDQQQGRQYDVAADGRFLINMELDDDVGTPITLIQDWNPREKRDAGERECERGRQ